MTETAPHIFGLVGPTASGKTGLAIALSRRFGAEIVGVDASQVYQRLDIGTGKATAAELGDVVHHLIDVVPPDHPFDAAAYVAHADAAIASIHARRRRALLCGGTGLYLRALVHGLCAAPPVDAAVAQSLRARLAAGEGAALLSELSAVDPVLAARLQPADRQRIERALGVFKTTGKPLSAWQDEHRFSERRHEVSLIGLTAPRPVLHARIAARVRKMFSRGLIAEVEGLIADGYGPHLRALSAIGYREVAAALRGEQSMVRAEERMVVATRRYARRQETWFRAVDGVEWFDASVDPDEVAEYLARRWPPLR